MHDFVWEQEEYALYLPGPWRRLPPAGDPLQLRLVCEPLETQLTLSIELQATAREDVPAWADRLMATRQASHREWLALPANRAPGRSLVISDEKRSLLEALDSAEVSYTGRITGFGLFGFIGYVTPRKVVSLFCETRLSFAPSRLGVFPMVARGFKNKLP
jgi:hypothetical protein